MLKILKHNNIVAFYFYEETLQTLSIFMEYVSGVSSISELSENVVCVPFVKRLPPAYSRRFSVLHGPEIPMVEWKYETSSFLLLRL